MLKYVNTHWANGWTLFTLSLYSAHRTHILPLCTDTLTQINRHRFQHQRYSILYIFPSVETKHTLTVFLFPESQQNRRIWEMKTFKNSCGDRCCSGADRFRSFPKINFNKNRQQIFFYLLHPTFDSLLCYYFEWRKLFLHTMNYFYC